MSVIAFKDGIMAADSRAYVGRYRASPGVKRKIHRLKNGSLLGVSSSQIGMADTFSTWVKNGAELNDWRGRWPDSLSAILVKPDGKVFICEDGLHFTGPIKGETFAIGSGCDFALGAMAAGKSARQAVLIAARLCPYSAVPVHHLKMKANMLCR